MLPPTILKKRSRSANRSPLQLLSRYTRWVLRVDNSELLKSVESVFVTVEPDPGKR